MNTCITYRYCDSDNYKATTVVILTGEITNNGINRIREACNDDGDGRYMFVPEAIGLPVERPGEYNPQCDHAWCYFCGDDFEGHFMTTDEAPTVKMNTTELIEAFTSNMWGWNELAEKLEKCRAEQDNDESQESTESETAVNAERAAIQYAVNVITNSLALNNDEKTIINAYLNAAIATLNARGN